jgi:putative ABC transport system permease protein
MITLALRIARAHAASLAGSFVALALGVMLVSSVTLALASTAGFAAPPSWFTKPDVVVSGQNSVSITSGTGKHEQTHSVRTPESRPVPADMVRPLSALGAAMVVDYAAYASVPGQAGGSRTGAGRGIGPHAGGRVAPVLQEGGREIHGRPRIARPAIGAWRHNEYE